MTITKSFRNYRKVPNLETLVIGKKLPSSKINSNLYGVIISKCIMRHWLENVASLNKNEEPKEFPAQMTSKWPFKWANYAPALINENTGRKDYTAGMS